MFGRRNRILDFQLDHDALGNGLLAREHNRVLDRAAHIADAKLRRLGPGNLQQFGKNAIDLHRLFLGVLDDGTRRAVGRQISAYDLDHSGNAGQRITDFVGQSGRQFSQSGEVLGARHLRLVQTLDLFTAGFKLRHHVIEVATQIADFVIA